MPVPRFSRAMANRDFAEKNRLKRHLTSMRCPWWACQLEDNTSLNEQTLVFAQSIIVMSLTPHESHKTRIKTQPRRWCCKDKFQIAT
eukprot:2813454-Amphidinium_carterae.1